MATEEEIIEGTTALLRCENEPWFFGPSDEKRVEAVLAAVEPLIAARLADAAEQAAINMIKAIVIALGGRVAIPMSVFEQLEPGQELVRYDDPATLSVVFETPHQQAA